MFCVVKIARLHQLVITHPASCWILWRCSHYWNTDWDKKIENVSPASIVVIVVSHWNVFIMSEPSKERIVEVCFIKHLLSLWIESYVGSSSEKGEVLILISLSSWLTEHQLQEKRRESAPLDQDCDKPLLSLSVYSSAGEDLLWLENDCDWILIKHSLNGTRKVKEKI